MRPALEWHSLGPLELKAEILARVELISQMVGRIYPAMLQDQIVELHELYESKYGPRIRDMKEALMGRS